MKSFECSKNTFLHHHQQEELLDPTTVANSKHTCILQQIFKTITHFVVDRLPPGGHDAVGDEPPVVVGGPPPPHRRQHVGADGRVVDVRGSAAAA